MGGDATVSFLKSIKRSELLSVCPISYCSALPQGTEDGQRVRRSGAEAWLAAGVGAAARRRAGSRPRRRCGLARAELWRQRQRRRRRGHRTARVEHTRPARRGASPEQGARRLVRAAVAPAHLVTWLLARRVLLAPHGECGKRRYERPSGRRGRCQRCGRRGRGAAWRRRRTHARRAARGGCRRQRCSAHAAPATRVRRARHGVRAARAAASIRLVGWARRQQPKRRRARTAARGERRHTTEPTVHAAGNAADAAGARQGARRRWRWPPRRCAQSEL